MIEFAGRAPHGRDAVGDPPEEERRDFQVIQHLGVGLPDRVGHRLVRGVVVQVVVDVLQEGQDARFIRIPRQ